MRLLSVNAALPAYLGEWQGEKVISGIAKTPLVGERVFVGTTGITGDGQADLSVHGGVDKALYVYPAIHWRWWENEKNLACWPGRFGENLTLDGPDETEIAIGDRFGWGEALLEVSQPRAPCYKLALYTERPDVPQALTRSGRCGWYFRVLREGVAPFSGPLEMVHASDGPSVREAFFALFHPVSADSVERVYAEPALAMPWRDAVSRRRKA